MRRKKYPPKNPVVNTDLAEQPQDSEIQIAPDPLADFTEPVPKAEDAEVSVFGVDSPWKWYGKEERIKCTTPGSTWTIREVMDAISSGKIPEEKWTGPEAAKVDLAEAVGKIQAAVAEGDKDTADKLKRDLPYMLATGIYSARKKGGLERHSGVLVLDRDKAKDEPWPTKEETAEIKSAFTKVPGVFYTFAGCSGRSGKAFLHAPHLRGLSGEEGRKATKRAHQAVVYYIRKNFPDLPGHQDPSGEAPEHSHGFSYDPEAIDQTPLFPAANLDWFEEIWKEMDRVRPMPPTHNSQRVPHKPGPANPGDWTPWKYYNQLEDAHQRTVNILLASGWEEDHSNSNYTYLTRPGKDSGVSGSVALGSGVFYTFTDNADHFAQREAVSPFEVLKREVYAGSGEEAARAVRKEFPHAFPTKDRSHNNGSARVEKPAPASSEDSGSAERNEDAPGTNTSDPVTSPTEDSVDRKLVVAYLHNLDLLDLHPLDDVGFLRVSDLQVVYRAILAERREGKTQVNREVFLDKLTEGGELKTLTIEEVRGWFTEEVESEEIEEWVAYLRQKFYTAQEAKAHKEAIDALANGDTAKSQDLIEQAVRMQGKAKGWDPFDRNEDWIDPALEESEQGWIVRDLLQRRNVSVVTAKSKRGKSAFVQTLLGDIARGQEVMGREVVPCRSLLVDNENSAGELAKRIKALQNRERWPNENMITTLRLRDPRNRDLCDFDQLLLRLRAECKRNDYGVVVIDPLYSLLDAQGVDTNSAADVLPYLTKLQRFADDCNVHLLVIAHSKKGDDIQIDLMDAVSGSGAFGRIVEVQIAITHHKRKDHYNVKIGGRSIPEKTTVWEVDFPAWHHRPDIEPAFRRQGEEQKEDEELDTLESYVLTHSAGISAKELAETYKNGAVSEKTVKRKLDQLFEAGRIKRNSRTRASGVGGRESVYFPKETESFDFNE